MRDIHPFTAPHNERAADSGNTATPMPLAIAAVSVAIDSISPMTFAVSRRRESLINTKSNSAVITGEKKVHLRNSININALPWQS